VVEELLCYTIPQSLFLNLARYNRPFQDYFFQNLSQKIASMHDNTSCRDLGPLMTGRVKDLDNDTPPVVNASLSIRETAFRMKELNTEAILVNFSNGDCGLVTSVDIVNGVVLAGLNAMHEIGTIATRSPVRVSSEELLFTALLQMTRHHVTRLIVNRSDETHGLLELVDLLSFLSNHSHLILGRVDRAQSVDEIRDALTEMPMAIRSLYSKGVKARHVARIAQEINRRTIMKLYTLLAPPDLAENSVLIVMGSGGRGEQLSQTDQDNALILRDGFDSPDLDAFRHNLTDTMVHLGFPACPGDIMISSAVWCNSLSRFQEMVEQWIRSGSPTDMINLAIFYDAIPVIGDRQLLLQLKKFMLAALPDNPMFFSRFAKPTVAFDTPLGLFSNFVLGKEGTSRNRLDIKKGGLFPIIHGIRSLALEARLRDVNTSKRIRTLMKMGVFDTAFADDLVEAFDFMSGIRFQSTAEHTVPTTLPAMPILGPGGNPVEASSDSLVDPASLTRWQRDLLKESLQTVNRMKRFIVHHFRLDLIG
jgi:CBS domain-containing protein